MPVEAMAAAPAGSSRAGCGCSRQRVLGRHKWTLPTQRTSASARFSQHCQRTMVQGAPPVCHSRCIGCGCMVSAVGGHAGVCIVCTACETSFAFKRTSPPPRLPCLSWPLGLLVPGFAAVGLAALLTRAPCIPDTAFIVAAEALAELAARMPEQYLHEGRLFPPFSEARSTSAVVAARVAEHLVEEAGGQELGGVQKAGGWAAHIAATMWVPPTHA
jgi:hypothetical protein